jgi:hypothetical protein
MGRLEPRSCPGPGHARYHGAAGGRVDATGQSHRPDRGGLEEEGAHPHRCRCRPRRRALCRRCRCSGCRAGEPSTRDYLIGEVANSAFSIYDIVGDPQSAPMAIFGMLLGGGALSRDADSLAKMGALRRGMSSADLLKLGTIFSRQSSGIQMIVRSCSAYVTQSYSRVWGVDICVPLNTGLRLGLLTNNG